MTTRRRALKRILATGATMTAGAITLLPRKANAYYSGPITDHFDGEVFFNPGGKAPKGLTHVARLYAFEKWERWPDQLPSPHQDKPPPQVSGEEARISFIGHASWLIQAGGHNILIDPHWSPRASPFSFAGPKRANPPAIAFDDLPRIDTVLVTHNHYDHLDIPTLRRLWNRHRPRIITPLGNDTIMKADIPGIEARAVDWGDSVPLGSGLIVHTEPTQHWSARGTRDRRHALWASFVIDTPAGKIYAIGDSGFGDGRTFRDIGRRHSPIRVALIPIGAYEPRWFMESQHMNPADAVRAFELCGAEKALGHHWGTFQLTAEHHTAPPQDLVAALDEKKIIPARFRPVQPGEVTIV